MPSTPGIPTLMALLRPSSKKKKKNKDLNNNRIISYCPNNQTVKGFVYGMENFGQLDDTTMNAIRLICYDDRIINST